jgi:thiosulfate/3-mercaptopyruvate sulfurtransferase
MFTTLISTQELAGALASPNLVLCDVRHDLSHPDNWGRSEYANAHLPGAQFVGIDRDLSATKTGTNGRHPLPFPEAAAALFGRLGIEPESQVVAYDQGSGMFAARLWWMLRWLGHEAVAVLDGGFAKWVREGRATSTQVPDPRPTTFDVRSVMPTVSATGIMASLAQHTLLLLDARAPERFRGDVEPLDPVAGHIPGARNRPFAQNLNADGTFKSPASLRADFDAVLAGTPHAQVVHQCGSGVTACHNILAMEIAGLPGTRLYPGSWSEWCSDPARPVARGDS